MPSVIDTVLIKVNDKIYLKDPETSELGKRIIAGSISWLHQKGFEELTFRKLAAEIGSTEASIYRYFESKHKLLVYLIAWYWAWMEYQLAFALTNISSPEERLSRALDLLTANAADNNNHDHFDGKKLYGIVVRDSSKSYCTSHVDEQNQNGYFLGYKRIVSQVAEIIQEIDPEYKYAHMLVSTVIEGAHHQRFFAEHLPRLTDVIKGEDAVSEFYKKLVFDTLRKV